MKLNEKTGLYENYGLWHVPFWQTGTFKMAVKGGLGLVALCLVLLLIGKYRAYSKRKKLPLWDQAILELMQLKKEHKVNAEHGKEFYLRVSALLKKYLHDRFGYDVIGKTDSEVIEYLKGNHHDEVLLEDLKVLLQGGVAIKFSHAQAVQEKMDQDYVRAIAIIQRTMPQKK